MKLNGINFLSNDIINGDPNILYYMQNVTKGGKYDFKRLGYGENVTVEQLYRGMPFNDKGIYASARDIGNWGAGYIAGEKGIPWEAARIVMDGLESYPYWKIRRVEWHREGQTTQLAERAGYKMGNMVLQPKIFNLLTKFMH